MKHFLRLIALFATMTTMTACNGLSIERVATLDVTGSAITIVRAAGGGYFVAAEPAVVLKIDNEGNVQWRHEELPKGIVTRLTMVSALADGGAIFCGERSSIKDSIVTQFPGFVIRLDTHGKEISRLDPMAHGFAGTAFFETLTCAPWGDGFVISALVDKKSVVIRLDSTLSVLWIKALAVGGIGFPTMMQPREISNGDLLFPSPGDVFLIEPTGNVKYHNSMPPCRWLQTSSFDGRLRFACESDTVGSSGRVVEYDESLNIKSSIIFSGKNTGFPLLMEISDGRFLSLIYSSNLTGPLATLFDSKGKEIETFTVPSGGLANGLPENNGTAAVILVTAERDNHFVPQLYWLKPR